MPSFAIKSEKSDTVVELSLERDACGDIELVAEVGDRRNTLMEFRQDGSVVLLALGGGFLEASGLPVDRGGKLLVR